MARIDPIEKQVTLISIPRDTKVEYQGETMRSTPRTPTAPPPAWWRRSATCAAVDISHYAEISFDGMVQLVDALGGVEVNVPDKSTIPRRATW